MHNFKVQHPSQSQNISILSGSIAKNMIIFSLPLAFSNVLQVLFNMVDIAVVGRFAGTIALGAVGSTPNLIFLFTGLLIGLSGGVNVIIAFYIGSKDKKSVLQTVHTAFFLCLFSGVILFLVGFFIGKPILVAMHTKNDLLQGAVLYFKIYMISMPATALYNFGVAIFSAIGETKKPLFFLVISGLVNVILDLLFVIVLKMDVAGVAVATVVAQYISAILMIISLMHRNDDVKLSFKKINEKIDKTKLVRLVKVGFPAGIQNAIFAFANVFVQMGVNSFDSTMVAGTAASANIDPLIYNVMNAVYVACATFIGQNFGANNRARVKKSYIYALIISFLVALCMGTILFFFGRKILSVFTTDSNVIESGMRRVKILAFSYCISAFMDCSIAACRGFGNTLMPSIFLFLGSCLFRIIWIYTIFAYFKTIESLFLLYVFSWTITALCEIIYFIKVYNQAFKQKNQ